MEPLAIPLNLKLDKTDEARPAGDGAVTLPNGREPEQPGRDRDPTYGDGRDPPLLQSPVRGLGRARAGRRFDRPFSAMILAKAARAC